MVLALKTNGCNCRNDSTWEPCGDTLICGDNNVEGVASAYAVLFGCVYGDDPPTWPITVLWKECLFDQTDWTARTCKTSGMGGSSRFRNTSCAGGGWAQSKGKPDNRMDPTNQWHQYFPPVWDDDGTPTWEALQFGCGEMIERGTEPLQNGWHDWYGRTYDCSGGPDYWNNRLNDETEVVWKLTILTTTTAKLEGFGQTQANGTQDTVIVYLCDEFSPLDRSTFVKEEGSGTEDENKYPCKVCVVPYYADWNTKCDTREDACNCADAGWDNICLDLSDFVCGSLDHRQTPISLYRQTSENWTFTNYNSGVFTCNLNLSGCDPWPSPAPCGVFTALIGCPGCASYAGPCGTQGTDCATVTGNGGHTLAFLVWCDGTDWNVRVLCLTINFTDPNGSGYNTTPTVVSCVTICDTVATLTDSCPDGARFTFNCGAITSDCCPDCGTPTGTISTTCCSSNLLPTTLSLTIAGAYSASVTLTWNAGTSRWEGSHTCGGCTLDYTLACTSGTTWTLTARVRAGTVCGGLACEANATGAATSCSPFSLTLTSTTGALCVCGAGAVTYTITL